MFAGGSDGPLLFLVVELSCASQGIYDSGVISTNWRNSADCISHLKNMHFSERTLIAGPTAKVEHADPKGVYRGEI